MTTLSHPAVDVAVDALTGSGGAARPVAAIERDGVVAVLAETPTIQAVVFVEHRDGEWTPPKLVNGHPRREIIRPATTGGIAPITRLCRKRVGPPVAPGATPEWTWFAATGTAAEDAVSVTITSSVDTHQVEVGADGLVFAVVRVNTDDEPAIVVRTRDGREVPVPTPLAE